MFMEIEKKESVLGRNYKCLNADQHTLHTGLYILRDLNY